MYVIKVCLSYIKYTVYSFKNKTVIAFLKMTFVGIHNESIDM